jgi:biopolymer transport protein ExbD
VRADASLPFAAIRHVLRSASGAGFAQITLLTSEGHWPCVNDRAHR